MLPVTVLEEAYAFWFGDVPEPTGERMPLWFGAAPDTDQRIAAGFGPAIVAAAATDWRVGDLTPRQRLGLILLLDQFPRNAYRGTPQAYAHDARARALSGAILGLEQASLSPIERMFLVLPFGHSEALADQQFAADYFASQIEPLVSTADGFWTGAKRQAELYRDIIARFGRFPQRNAVLGRTTTAEEEAFLEAVTLTP